MRSIARWLPLCLALLPALAEAGPQRVALVPLSSSGKGAAQVAASVVKAIATGLRKSHRVQLKLVDAGHAAKLRLCLQQASCARAVGGKLGVSLLLTGHVEAQGGGLHVDLRVISAGSGEVAAAEAFDMDSPKAHPPALQLAQRLIGKAGTGKGKGKGKGGADDGAVTKSEAEAAAAILEQRDTEDPLAGKKKPAASGPSRGAPVVAAPAPPPPRRSFGRRYWHAFLVGSAGVAAMGVAVTFGLVSRGAVNDAYDTTSQHDAFVLRDKAQKNALVANICYGAGGALLATSALLFILQARSDRADERARLRLGLDVSAGRGLLVAGGRF